MEDVQQNKINDGLREFMESHVSEWGIHEYGFLTTDRLKFSPDVRTLCEQNSCGCYDTRWTCPPAVGTYEECQKKIMEFQNVFVYSTKHELEDSFDFEGMMDGAEAHGKVCLKVSRDVKEEAAKTGTNLLIFSGGSCRRCSSCTYPEPCRFPEETYPTIESYGVEVNRLASAAKVKYINGANTVTYFGCIMW